MQGRATELADAAVAAVRRGHRDATRLRVLWLAVQAMLRPDLVHHRLTLHDEMIELASELGEPAVLAGSLATRAADRADLLQLDGARADLDRAEQLARQHRLPQNLLIIGWSRSTLRQMDGDLADADAVIGELEALQATLAVAGEGIGLCQRAVLRFVEGRLPELEPHLRAAASFYPLFRELHALALVEAGRLDEAREVIGPWAALPEPPWDYLWTTYVAVRARIWSALGDQVAVAALREALTPYAGQCAGTLPVAFLGSNHQVLGDLAAAAGDTEAAREHLLLARKAHEDAGLELWVARSEAALATLESS
jgi:tetratricopeptide (TPR) repeat protein